MKRLVLVLCLILISCSPFRRQTQSYNVYLAILEQNYSVPSFGIGSTYGDCDRIVKTRAEWMYNWGPNPPQCAGVRRTAMWWGRNSTGGPIGDGIVELLWWNEPDQWGQANMTPEEAAYLWNATRPWYGNLTHGSPAVNNLDWLYNWLPLVTIKPDFLAIHVYESRCDYAEAQRRFRIHLQWIDDIADEYDLPVWITEYAWATDDPRGPEWVIWSKEEISLHPRITHAAWFQDYYYGTESWAVIPNMSLTRHDRSLNELGLAYAGY